MSTRKIVVIPEDYSGPWSAQFSCPMTVYLPDNSRKFAVLVTDPGAVLPPEAQVYELGPLDTLAGVMERAGLSRTPASVFPEPTGISSPVITPSAKPSMLKRFKRFFTRS